MMQERSTSRGLDPGGITVRVATYREDGEPEIAEVSASGSRSAAAKISAFVGSSVARLGGSVPSRAVGEVIENLIHADYAGVVVSVMDGGQTVRVSDRGPGIVNKSQALKFGFSGASQEATAEIRAIGAGLGIASAEMKQSGGTLSVEDNLGGGTVVTLSTAEDSSSGGSDSDNSVSEDSSTLAEEEIVKKRHLGGVPEIDISERQERTLITVLECGEVGPSTIAEMVDVSVSTSYRDLSVLEDHGLATSTESGKRIISPLGRDYAAAIIKTWVR